MQLSRLQPVHAVVAVAGVADHPAGADILLVEVNSHERVMQRLAQARADSLATTIAALVGARFDYARDILVQLAGSLRAEATVNESALSLFSVGLARYRANGELVSAPSVGRWQATAQVRTLARWVSPPIHPRL